MITWAASDGRESGGDVVVPAASTIKLFVASAFWRSGLDAMERVAVNEEARRLGAESTQVGRFMVSEGPENLTCARDLARGLAAIDEERVLEALPCARDSLLPYLLPGRDVRVKTGELESVYHEAALVDKSLAVAVCSQPAVLPSEVAAVAAAVVADSLD